METLIKRMGIEPDDIRLSWAGHALVLLLTILGLAALVHVANDQHREDVVAKVAERQRADLNLQAATLAEAVAGLRRDVLLIAHAQHLDASGPPPARAGMEALFGAFLASRPDYFQVRYLGATAAGPELARVERRDGRILAVPAPELQNKGDRDYFQAGMKLAEGEVYLSEFNLNREHGGIQLPLYRTLRAATPVFDGAGHRQGLVVINMDIGPTLARLAGIGGNAGSAYVVDSQGHYLVHPDPALAFSFEIGNRHRLESDFPVLRDVLKAAAEAADTVVFGQYRLNGDDYHVAVRSLRFDPARPVRHLLLVRALPESGLVREYTSFLKRMGLGELVAVALILLAMVMLVKATLLPLAALRRAVAAMAEGRYQAALPAIASGELGALVREFGAMREQVYRRKQALRSDNSILTEQLTKEAVELSLAGGIFDNSSEGVMVTDSHSRIIAVNPAFTEITGYSAEEAIGKTPRLMRSEHHPAEFYQALWRSLESSGRWQGEIWNRRKSGEVFCEWLTIIRVVCDNAEGPYFVALFTDITELRRKDERIHRLAFRDPLTGLPNRSLALDRLQHAIDMARRSARPLGAMLIDLDRFKTVNDVFGHDIGDLLLKAVAERLAGMFRSSDTVARLGGDEFLVIMEEASEPEECAALAERVIRNISEPIEIQGRAIQIGASVGMAFCPNDAEEVTTLIKHADVAMYAAKADGKGVFRFFRTDMNERATKFLSLEMELRLAIENGELELHYQPKVALADGALHGVEALVRWRHASRGLVSPADFIPVAEESGLIVELGDWVLREACRQAALWQGRMGVIAVNLSARQCDKVDLVGRIRELTGQYGIDPALLQLELTESTVMTHPERAIELLDRVHELGVTVAVDDFGTGYSSLSYLRRLPIDTLKIDRSFILNLGMNEEDSQIVGTIIALGQILKMTVVAEGVETEAHAQLLRDLGCDLAQGYLFARPQPAAELEKWRLLRQNGVSGMAANGSAA
jgi:diguanylate cyclase (GGDEF)-like protein/PAS domain S-box-containing protein